MNVYPVLSMESEAAQVKGLFSPDQSPSELHLLLLKNKNAEVVVRRLFIGDPNYLLKFYFQLNHPAWLMSFQNDMQCLESQRIFSFQTIHQSLILLLGIWVIC